MDPGISAPKNYLYTSILNWTKLKDWWYHRQGKRDGAGSEGESEELSRLEHGNLMVVWDILMEGLSRHLVIQK